MINDNTPESFKLDELAARVKALVASRETEGWAELLESISSFRSGLPDDASEDIANKAWFLAHACQIRITFIKAFSEMKADGFYPAWCDLERVETDLSDLFKNPFWDINEFGANQLRRLVEGWQSLFPYAIFFSPEIIIKCEVCSICGRKVDPWSSCRHCAGRVYRGQLCYRIVEKMEFVSVSLVRDPVQKYSVLFTSGPDGSTIDHYDYSIVRFLIDRLTRPFDEWSYHWTKAYHPHDMFADHDRDGSCPCNSGQTYADCCATQPGVMRPHIQFSFERTPPSELPNAYLAGYKEKNRPARLTGHD